MTQTEESKFEGYDFGSITYLDPKGQKGYPQKTLFSSSAEYLTEIKVFEALHAPEINQLWRDFLDSEILRCIQNLEKYKLRKYKAITPAIDVKDNILFIGFTDKTFDPHEKKNKWQTKNLHLVVQANPDKNKPNTFEIIDQSQVEINSTLYVFEDASDGTKRRLPRISDRWSNDHMYKCQKDSFVDKVQLYQQIKIQLKLYLKLEREEDYEILTSYIISTYFHRVFKAIGYIHLKAMKGSGKTTCLHIMRSLAFNGSKEIATVAAMRDKIDGQCSTFIVDQADSYLGTKSLSGMVDVFADSYKKSGGRMSKMVEIKKKYVAVDFETYSPKVFASIKELHFDLRDRCIQIPLIKTKENLSFLEEDAPIWLELRDKLYRLLINEYITVKDLYETVNHEYKATNEIINRQLELWSPLEAIMRLCEVEKVTIENCKKLFKLRGYNTEDQLSSNDWTVINFVLKQLETEEAKWIELKDISTAVLLSDDEEEDVRSLSEKSRHARNIISRLNLSSDKGRVGGKGNVRYFFERQKVKQIEEAYLVNSVDTSQVLTEAINPEIF